MKVIIETSTDARLEVWRDFDGGHELFLVKRTEEGPRVVEACLGVDLFEVVGELAGLNLESEPELEEAVDIADQAIDWLRSDAVPRGRVVRVRATRADGEDQDSGRDEGSAERLRSRRGCA
jgi:hypothetical protein